MKNTTAVPISPKQAQSLPTGTNGTSNRHEEICARAYELYLERGGTHGRDIDDWLQAEAEFLLLKSQTAA